MRPAFIDTCVYIDHWQLGLHAEVLDDVRRAFLVRHLEAETIEIEGIPVRVATPRTLHRMKRDTLRLQDKADADAIRRKFGLEEDRRARSTLR